MSAARQSDVGARCACGAAALKLAGRSRAEVDGRRVRAGLALALLLFLSLAVVPAVALVLPTLGGRVVDDANILDPPTRAALDQKLAELEAKTTDQLVIVTLKSLQGTSIEDFGVALGSAAGFGGGGEPLSAAGQAALQRLGIIAHRSRVHARGETRPRSERHFQSRKVFGMTVMVEIREFGADVVCRLITTKPNHLRISAPPR